MINLETAGLEEKTIIEKPKKKETKKIKELLIRPTGTMAMYEIYYEGGGEVPKALNGAYTCQLMAQKDIDMYLAQRRKR